MQEVASPTEYIREVSNDDHELARLLNHPDQNRGSVHTPREIAQQPFLWRRTARQIKRHRSELRQFLESAGLYASDDPAQLVFAGAGSSDYVGRSVADLLRVRLNTPATNWPTTRLTVAPETLLHPQRPSVLVHFARSGNSPESTATFEWVRNHRRETIRQLVITCNGEGDLAERARRHPQHAHLLVLDEAANDEGLAMTSSFTSMVVAGQALGYLDRMDEFEEVIDRVSGVAEHVLTRFTDSLSALAGDVGGRAFYLGNNDLLGAAAESALKVQELTAGDVVAQGEDTMAFRHGPISAVDRGTLVCFFLSSDPYVRRYETDVLDQFREAFDEMGVHLVTFGPTDRAQRQSNGVLSLGYGDRDVPPYFQVGPAVLVGQLVGLFAAHDLGLNVDDPSKEKALYSRTVQGVTLYDGRDEATEGEL